MLHVIQLHKLQIVCWATVLVFQLSSYVIILIIFATFFNASMYKELEQSTDGFSTVAANFGKRLVA